MLHGALDIRRPARNNGGMHSDNNLFPRKQSITRIVDVTISFRKQGDHDHDGSMETGRVFDPGIAAGASV
jgi:hypothetical protein